MALLVLHTRESGALSAPVLRRLLRQAQSHALHSLVVASELSSEWADREAYAWIESKRLVLLPPSGAETFSQTLRELLNTTPQASQREQPVVVMPLLVRPDWSQASWQTPWGALLHASTRLITDSQQSPFVTGHTRIRLMPWVACDSTLSEWPDAIWDCELALSNSAVVPLGYTFSSQQGGARSEAWIAERLFHDLNVLQQLSQRQEDLDHTFARLPRDTTARHVYSGFNVRAFLPWASEGSAQLLRQLQTHLEPAPALAPTLLPESWGDSLKAREQQHRDLSHSLQVKATAFDKNPTLQALESKVRSQAEGLGPHPTEGPRRWPTLHGYGWSPYLSPHQSQDFGAFFKGQLPTLRDTLEKTALETLRPTFRKALEAIEKGLQEDLARCLSVESTTSQPLTRFLDTLELYLSQQLRAFRLLNPQTPPTQSLEALLEPLIRSQTEAERTLYAKARLIPAIAMRALEASTWAIAAPLLWWGFPGPWDLRIGATVGGLGLLSTWLNVRQLRHHLGHIKRTEDAPDSWLKWRQQWLSTWPELLQHILDSLLPHVQMQVLQELKQLQRQLELRLEFVAVQREGLRNFAEHEQHQLSQLRKRHPHHPELGLFQIELPLPPRQVQTHTLTQRFAELWQDLGRLDLSPRPIALSEYRSAIAKLAQEPQKGTLSALSPEHEPLASLFRGLQNTLSDSRLTSFSQQPGQFRHEDARLVLLLHPSLDEFEPLLRAGFQSSSLQRHPFVEEDTLIAARYRLLSYVPTNTRAEGALA